MMATSNSVPVSESALRVVSSMAPRTMLTELLRAYEERSRERVWLEAVGGVDVARRVRDGESFDVVVLAREALDDLLASGHLAPRSAVDLVHSKVAIAVRAGARHPDVSSEASLRSAVLEARAIGYSTGPSGRELGALFERWGIAERLRGRITVAPAGVPVASLVASGEVALGFQQLSELLHVEGIEVVGPLPEAIQITTVFSAAIGAASERAEAARALLTFLTSADAVEAKRRHGMDPIPTGDHEP